MFITVASFKGGVGKTTTAVHLAAYLQQKAPTLLVDGDPNRSATTWAQSSENGTGLPFKIVSEKQAGRYTPQFQHVVIDTEAHPDAEDLRELADSCELLVLPTTPDALALNATMQTVAALDSIGAKNYQVLLTICPPRPSRDADEAREMLTEQKVNTFKGQIHRLVSFQKAALQGITVDKVNDPRALVAWADYEAIGREILK